MYEGVLLSAYFGVSQHRCVHLQIPVCVSVCLQICVPVGRWGVVDSCGDTSLSVDVFVCL